MTHPAPDRAPDGASVSRRLLLATSGAACAALGGLAQARQVRPPARTCVFDGLQPVALTISGPGIEANRAQTNDTTDRMLVARGLRFDKAWACGMDAITSLEYAQLDIPLEYDDARHRLAGPLLETCLQAAGLDIAAAMRQGWWLGLYGIDGYHAQMPLAQAMRWRLMVATHLDGQPLAVGGLGPLWAIYDARVPAELAATPLKQRFAQAVWGLYYLRISETQPRD